MNHYNCIYLIALCFCSIVAYGDSPIPASRKIVDRRSYLETEVRAYHGGVGHGGTYEVHRPVNLKVSKSIPFLDKLKPNFLTESQRIELVKVLAPKIDKNQDGQFRDGDVAFVDSKSRAMFDNLDWTHLGQDEKTFVTGQVPPKAPPLRVRQAGPPGSGFGAAESGKVFIV